MKLIGMLDSPYVRRVAISLRRLGIAFEHEPLSVFSTFERFRRINPVVKAPTLVCDGGESLMDSTLIIDYLEALAGPGHSLMPSALPDRLRALRVIGLALAAAEKTVQIVYERNLRPVEKQHAPWLERVNGQLLAAYAELEAELVQRPLQGGETIGQDGITVAVVWSFTRMMLGDALDTRAYPALDAFASEAERLAIFLETPAR
ncbi:glutathione S-transferase [Pseudomonas kuykendallii]|uniref:Glutathione S-transferase n=1 Tax=Pseudomonas kuykendallii TaxID=1007099 RepID=A0A1H3C2Q2_9PSED|nr:glutathione S-transferase [Pseudomonas kuykendallii]MCQ4269691.1 glutathione S-transferase [Pseudomonas kuykendallii]SDX48386.1 Glutathione S-transferase [Pseudomonas kuykendallii]